MSKKTCIKAYHEMEERYARLILCYYNTKQRKEICDVVTDAIDKYQIAPLTSISPDKDLEGEYSLEFHDDYDRESCNFFEFIIEKLNIIKCEFG